MLRWRMTNFWLLHGLSPWIWGQSQQGNVLAAWRWGRENGVLLVERQSMVVFDPTRICEEGFKFSFFLPFLCSLVNHAKTKQQQAYTNKIVLGKNLHKKCENQERTKKTMNCNKNFIRFVYICISINKYILKSNTILEKNRRHKYVCIFLTDPV